MSQHAVLCPFEPIAVECGRKWIEGQSHAELWMAGFVVRVHWLIDRIPGVFVTIARDVSGAPELGLPYVVEFRNGSSNELAAATSNDAERTAVVARRFLMPYLAGVARDFDGLEAFVRAKVNKRLSM